MALTSAEPQLERVNAAWWTWTNHNRMVLKESCCCELTDLLPGSAPPVNDTSLQCCCPPPAHAPTHAHLPQIKPHACESSSKGREIVPERRTAVNSHPAPFGPRDAANKQTAARGKGWSHNLPLDWRQVSGNFVMFRDDATILKEWHPEFMIICRVLTCCVITFL